MTFGKREEQIFLGREIAKTQDYSEDTALLIDKEIKRFVMDNYDRARKTLTEHKTALIAIADELLAREVLDADQVTRLAKGLALEEPLPVHPPSPTPTNDTPRREPAERPGIVPPLGKPITQE
jgi:cell division protease FtsH